MIKAVLGSKWFRFGAGIPLFGLGVLLAGIGNTARDPILIFFGFAIMGAGVVTVIGGMQLEGARHLGKQEKGVVYNCLEIYPDKVEFALRAEMDLLGQPQKCLNDGRYYHVHMMREKTTWRDEDKLKSNINQLADLNRDKFVLEQRLKGVMKAKKPLPWAKDRKQVLATTLSDIAALKAEIQNTIDKIKEAEQDGKKLHDAKWGASLFILPDDDETKRYYDPVEFANVVTMPCSKKALNWAATVWQTVSVAVIAIIIVAEVVALIAIGSGPSA